LYVSESTTYAYHPLDLRQSGVKLQGVIDQLIVTHAAFALGLTNWLQLGAQVPYVVYNRFQDPNTIPGTGFTNKMSLGDVEVEAKIRLLDLTRHKVGIAFLPYATLPVGKSTYFVGDATYAFGGKLLFDWVPHPKWLITLNAALQYNDRVTFYNINYRERLFLGLGSRFKISPLFSLFAEVNAFGPMNSNFFNNGDLNQSEALAGVAIDSSRIGLGAKLAGGTCISCGVGGARVRGVAQLSYRYMNNNYRSRDKQYDNAILALFDKTVSTTAFYELQESCPADAEEYSPDTHDRRCPKYYELRDVAALYFSCPDAEKFDPKIHDPACPKVFSLADKYSEFDLYNMVTLSVSQMKLRCPNNPEDFDSALHDPGCPKYYELASVVELMDTCPAPEAFAQGIDSPRCPKYYELRQTYASAEWSVVEAMAGRDSDGDGILDFDDACPGQMEDKNGIADYDGCPDNKRSVIAGGQVLAARPVYFDFNSWDLGRDAVAALDDVVAVLNQNTWIRTVKISGHTDSIGSSAVNKLVSERRSGAVIKMLQARGIRKSLKLDPVAFGASKPAAPNNSAYNRAKNRRVLFTIR